MWLQTSGLQTFNLIWHLNSNTEKRYTTDEKRKCWSIFASNLTKNCCSLHFECGVELLFKCFDRHDDEMSYLRAKNWHLVSCLSMLTFLRRYIEIVKRNSSLHNRRVERTGFAGNVFFFIFGLEIELPIPHEEETQFRLNFPNGIVKWISDEIRSIVMTLSFVHCCVVWLVKTLIESYSQVY